MTTDPVVWIIDAQQWPRAYLRAELIGRGFEAVGYTELSNAVAALRHRATTRPEIIVLELHDQAAERGLLDALKWSGIPVILLVGAVEANEQAVTRYNWGAVMRRPLTIGSIADKVEELMLH